LHCPNQLSHTDCDEKQWENRIDDEPTAGPQEAGAVFTPDCNDQGNPDSETDQSGEKTRNHHVPPRVIARLLAGPWAEFKRLFAGLWQPQGNFAKLDVV
jgi:hypothetical protein